MKPSVGTTNTLASPKELTLYVGATVRNVTNVNGMAWGSMAFRGDTYQTGNREDSKFGCSHVVMKTHIF